MADPRPGPIFTIGYEKADIESFVATLRKAGIVTLVDVRAVPASRKRDFSKTRLAAFLEAAGIGYRHLRGLGNPKAGREAAHEGRLGAFQKIFSAHMETPAAKADLDVAAGLTQEAPVCLMCLERDPTACHRTIVAMHLARQTGQDITALRVDPLGAAKGGQLL